MFLAWQVIGNQRTRVQLVAVKVAKPKTGLPKKRFSKECQELCDPTWRGQPGSEYVVAGIEHFTEATQSVLVMEYLDGVSLKNLVRNRPRTFSIRKGLLLCRSFVRGLQAFHSRSCLHRDIKPQNLIFVKNRPDKYHVSIVDLGLLKDKNDPVTDPYTLAGSPRYSAPECFIDSSAADERADIYSVAAVLQFLLVGEPPAFELRLDIGAGVTSKNLRDLAAWSQPNSTWPRPKLSELRSDCPSNLCDLTARALHPDRDKRPTSIKEVLDCLEEVLNSIEHARVIEAEAIPALRTNLKTILDQTVDDLRVHDAPTNLKFLSEQIETEFDLNHSNFPDGIRISPALAGAEQFNSLIASLATRFDNWLMSIDAKLSDNSVDDATLADALDEFQMLLPQFLIAEHTIRRLLIGVANVKKKNDP